MNELPDNDSLGLDGAHGAIVLFEDRDAVAKVVAKKPGKGIPMEMLGELMVRDRCAQDRVQNNILPIVEVYETPDSYAMVMPYMAEGDLFQLLSRVQKKDEDSPPIEKVFAIVRDFLTAVCAMHVNSVAHRDIKDPNVLLKDDYSGALLCDMSLSTSLEHNTEDRFVPYTVGYRPPEVQRYERDFMDQLNWYQTDVHAAGAVVAKVLLSLSGRWNHPKPPTRKQFEALYPAAEGSTIKDTVLSMMSVRPERRPSARDLLAAMNTSNAADIAVAMFVPRPPPHNIDKAILGAVRKMDFEECIAQVGSDILANIPESEFADHRVRAVLATALAAKSCYSLDESHVCKRFKGVLEHLQKFIDFAAGNPAIIRACHSSIC